MPGRRQKQTRYAEPASRAESLQLDNVPGPEDDAETLNRHYRRVRVVFASHAHDLVIQLCHWCLKWGELAFAKRDESCGIRRMYCTARCANAYSAYVQKVVMVKGRIARPSTGGSSGVIEDDSYGAPPGTTRPAKTRRRRNADVVTGPYTGAPPGSIEEPGAVESALEPVAMVESAGTAKRHKGRAKKAARADGLCAKGLHDMTADNLYEYNGNIWCRECRKASRAKSAEKRNGS